MKTQNLLLTTFLLIITASFSMAQQPEKIEAIQKVVVSNGIILQIKQGPDYTLKITSQGLKDDCLIKTIENGTLTLKMKSVFGCRGKVIADLTCPSLKRIEATAKAVVSIGDLYKGDSLSLLLRTGAQADLSLDIKYLQVKLTEGALFSADGYAVVQKVSVLSFSTYSCFKLEGDSVDVSAVTGGKAKVYADKELKAKSASACYIGYKGNPAKKTLKPTGNGVIEQIKN